MEIFRLFGSILVNSDQADASLQRTDSNAEGVGKTLIKGVGTAVKWGAGIVTATGVAVGGMLAMANKTAQTADEIDKLSERTGIGREELQRWKYAAGQSGADIGKLEVGIKKLSDVMVGASTGSEANIEAFSKLGISLNDLKTKSQEDIFSDVMTALAEMPQGAERNALGNDLLGKSYTEMLPLLNAGGKGMEDLKNRADELGLVMSDSAVKANVVFGDSLADVQQSFGMVTANISTAFLPIVQSVLDWTLEHTPQIQSFFQVAFKGVTTAVTTVGDITNNYLIPAFKKTYETTEDVINWIIKFQDILIPLGLGISAGAVTFGIYTLAINASALATTTWTTITGIATTAGTAFGAVLAFITSPIGIVVVAIGALVTAGVLLYQNWDVVKVKATEIFGHIGKFVGGVIDGIKNGFKGMVNGVITGLNFMIKALNKLKFEIPDWVPGLGGKGFGLNIPTIPSFEVGTRYLPQDMLIQAHKGEMIVPKSENPYANSNGNIINNTERKIPTTIQLVLQNGKAIAEFIVDDIDILMGNKNKIVGRSIGI